MKNITLVEANAGLWKPGVFTRHSSFEPLGLEYLGAVLKQEGYNVNILQQKDKLADEFLQQILDTKPDLVGFSTMTYNFPLSKSLANIIKEANHNIYTLFGGVHISSHPKSIDDKAIDFGVIGEGEYTTLELVEALEKNKDLSKIKGLVYKKDNKTIINKPKEFIQDLDSLPFPARHLLPNLSLYRPKPTDYKELPVTSMITSRGCPYQCTFCDNNIFGKKARFHSPEYVVKEIEHLINNYGIKDIKINDDTFILDKKRVLKICDLIIQKNIKIKWSCSIRANLADEELLKKMKQAGCWEVFLGVESGNQKILDLIKKSITIEQVKKVCKIAYDLGFQIKTAFILGHPTETKETIEQTINIAKELPSHYPSFTLMTVFPNTEMEKIASKYGTFEGYNWRKMSTMYANFIPYGLTKEYLEKKQRQAFKKAYLNSKMITRHLKNIRSINDIKRYVAGGITILKL